MAISSRLKWFVEEHASDWVNEAMHGYANKGRGLLLVCVDQQCLIALPHYLSLREVEHMPALMRCLAATRNYSPENEVAVAFTHGNNKIECCATFKREMIRPNVGEDSEE